MKVKLTRNLRRSILQGQPWIYRGNFTTNEKSEKSQLCQVLDAKGELGWGIYDPHSPLAIRMLHFERERPNQKYFLERFSAAKALRRSLRKSQGNGFDTNAYRLFNGEGDLLPGLVCDVYDSIAVVQFDGQGPSEFWDRQMIGEWLLKNNLCTTVIEKTRRSAGKEISLLGGEQAPLVIDIKENGVKFRVDIENGQKTGFFLDQRDNREFVKTLSAGRSVLNLFSYSGGFSAYAGVGGAKKVTSVDIAKGAIELANQNWLLNGLQPGGHEGICDDVFTYLDGITNKPDHIIVDPPSLTHSEGQKELAIKKYVEIFSAAAKKVNAGGELSLSSCSSHITFQDFFEIIAGALSNARKRGQIVRVSGQGIDHPFPHAAPELRYLKFVHLILSH